MSEVSLTYAFRNEKLGPTRVIIEPWAEEFTVSSVAQLSLDIYQTEAGLLETEISQKYFTIWLWRGCRAKVFVDGKDRTPPSLSIPVPL